ncbi:MAG TPA: aldolase/citrate lyase family protein [Solirubrobacterales bacterium]|jgi:2-keto-3-deoxy-L-rhamnonate aldolase RhmA
MPESLRDKLRAGRRLTGTVLTLPGVTVAELLAEPFDVVWIDLEHGALGPRDAQEMIIGAQAAGAFALVRLPVAAHGLMTTVLDAGADGLVIADVSDPEQVVRVVSRATHPPAGSRGWGPRRLALRHRTKGGELSEPSIWIQIESRLGVERIEELISVEGIDAVCVGTADLSFSLGAPLDMGSSALHAALERVAQACADHDIHFTLAGSLEAAPPTTLGRAAALIHSTDAKLCAQAADSAAAWMRGILEPEKESSGR